MFVMRFVKFTFLMALLLVASVGHAFAQVQDDGTGRRVYNGVRGGAGPELYNAQSYHSSSGPISLPQILSGRNGASSDTASSYYGGKSYRPYSIDGGSSYSLALSPSEIRESRARRDSMARRLERENMQQLMAAESGQYDSQRGAYMRQFQQNPTANSNPVYAPRVRTRYKQKRKDRFEMPQKVFNSLR